MIHTTRGGVYKGDVAERPRGLTTEQAEDQRTGAKIDERQTREAAQRAIEAKPRRTRPRTDELAEAPYGKKSPIRKK